MKIEILTPLGKSRFMEVKDLSEIEVLRHQGVVVLSTPKTPLPSWVIHKRLTTPITAEFFRDLASFLDAGVPLNQAIGEILNSSPSGPLAGLLHNIQKDLNEGFSFWEALRATKAFPKEVIYSVKSGESAGLLPVTFQRLADFYEKRSGFESQVQTALVYPVFVLVLVFVISTFISVFVFPKIKEFLSLSNNLPVATKALLVIFGALSKYWFLFPVVIIAGFFFLRWLASTQPGIAVMEKLSGTKAGLPFRSRILASFFDTLAILSKNGVPLTEALSLVNIQSSIFQRSFGRVRDKLKIGYSFSEAFREEGIAPAFIVAMLTKGEKAAALDEYLEKIAKYYWQKTETGYVVFSKLAGPILTVVAAGFVILFGIGFLLPVYSQVGNLRAFSGF